jgi:hypothetical protein
MYKVECELCNKLWCSNSIDVILQEFYDHLNKHTKEEVLVLRKLAELELKDPSAYQQLKESLMRLEYVMRRNRQ